MDLITLDKTWSVAQYPIDFSYYTTTNTRCAYSQWARKQVLEDAGWDVAYSSDKTNVGATDYWTDYTKIFSAAPGTAHSWVVLTNADFSPNFAICIDCTQSGSYGQQATVVVAPDGFNTDGTILNRPTAVSRNYTWTNIQLHGWNNDYHRGTSVKCFYSSDSECFRVITTVDGQAGIGYGIAGSVILIEKPKQPVSWWPSPFIVGCFAAGVSAGGLYYTNVTAPALNNIIAYVGNDVVQLRMGTMGINGTWLTHLASCGYGTSYSGSPIMPPIYYTSESTSYPGIMGVAYDMYPAPKYHLSYTRYKTTNNPKGLTKIGCVAMGCPYGYFCA